LRDALDSLGIPYHILDRKDAPLDIWIRDWGFVDRWCFRFAPSYARHLYSPADIHRARASLARLIGIRPQRVPLVLDGGNLVHNGEVAIVTEKVFADNPHLSREEIERIFRRLGFKKTVFVPVEPGDVIGHADGMVRFVSRKLLLFNDYTDSYFSAHRRKLIRALCNARLEAELVPFPWYCSDDQFDGVPSADGCYINFIQTKQGIIYPTFHHRLDDRAGEILAAKVNLRLLRLEALAVARLGGVLNCISQSHKYRSDK
jgi:agmatine/peptidylarginine deiminase